MGVQRDERRTNLAGTSLLIRGLITIGIAVVINVVVWAIGSALLDPPSSFAPFATVFPTILFTVIFLAIGIGIYAVLLRRSADPNRLFLIVATVALLLSFLNFFALRGQEGNGPGAILVLAIMHVVAYVVAVVVLTGQRFGR
ncbi:MAG: hypothetical protein AVDCRST_MAG70-1196 [uncultured Thermomicrobiales bacterium]|uniref:Uncharacterized protein n=1 Tax=uncultured Thermomicrobiales bacterium TaxID=1645740 RepID=A0A6J4URN1_9BACT|nr:MAG: hypothetical protein AVDCRST_MAG70-1196 [uncultured Thermomicrobiales bacterium]